MVFLSQLWQVPFSTSHVTGLSQNRVSRERAEKGKGSKRGHQKGVSPAQPQMCRLHFHLVVETPQANLVAGMKWFLGSYTSRFNRRHKLFGHLFSGRYKSLLVEGGGGGYLKTVCDYVHLNPVRAKLLAAREPLQGYRWSTYGAYLQGPAKRSAW